MNVDLLFPGGQVIEGFSGGFGVRTDQPIAKGGGGSAPSPFQLFVFSHATCAGPNVLAFLRGRGLSSAGLGMRVTTAAAASGVLSEVNIQIEPPEGLPEKYLPALERAAAQCLVKQQLEQPPLFRVESVRALATAASA